MGKESTTTVWKAYLAPLGWSKPIQEKAFFYTLQETDTGK